MPQALVYVKYMRWLSLIILCTYLLHRPLADVHMQASLPQVQPTICCCANIEEGEENTACCYISSQGQTACAMDDITGHFLRPAPCSSTSPVAFIGFSAPLLSHLIPSAVDISRPFSPSPLKAGYLAAAYSLAADLPDKIPIS
ncbi:MAG: hypothetical protein GKR89_02125 [Candidatus Latescibacteria bacterium]|nr:hypothetical protein [Candidatus Latescibacterota bacterium]